MNFCYTNHIHSIIRSQYIGGKPFLGILDGGGPTQSKFGGGDLLWEHLSSPKKGGIFLECRITRPFGGILCQCLNTDYFLYNVPFHSFYKNTDKIEWFLFRCAIFVQFFCSKIGCREKISGGEPELENFWRGKKL